MTNQNDAIVLDALQAAVDFGVEFAEVRLGHHRRQMLAARDSVLTTSLDETTEGIAIRVFHKGNWGFAACPLRTRPDFRALARQAVQVAEASSHVAANALILTPIDAHVAQWHSPMVIDPFTVPLTEKCDLLFTINRILADHPAIRETVSHMQFTRMHKLYVNSLGSHIDQTILRSDADYSATAVGNGRFERRSYQSIQRASGYESIDANALIQAAPRVAREAADQLAAPAWDADTADLILMPNHTRLVIHETIGHATELDRVLGWEADYAGTSFATPEKCGTYSYGSPLFSVTADRTL
ncbi:hypothetical protein JXA80_10815, partial [bacterium]|nr:hypothetical protein [candidate division CSSED10-310 bacterium]